LIRKFLRPTKRASGTKQKFDQEGTEIKPNIDYSLFVLLSRLVSDGINWVDHYLESAGVVTIEIRGSRIKSVGSSWSQVHVGWNQEVSTGVSWSGLGPAGVRRDRTGSATFFLPVVYPK